MPIPSEILYRTLVFAEGFDPLAIVWHRRCDQARVTRLEWRRDCRAPPGSAADIGDPPRPIRKLALQLRAMLAGQAVHPSLERVDFAGATAFQREVWRAAHTIPWGRVVHYGRLAEWLGKPGAARAVGQALGANPLPLIVPCHRIINADGSLGGFSGPAGMKARLLRLEGVTLDRNRRVRASR